MSSFEHFGFGVPWEDLANYSQAVRAGDRLYISGQLSHDMDGNFLHEGDVEAQADVAFANIDVVLRRFGAGRTGDHRPASNAFGVVALALPEQLIEIAATAVLPSAVDTSAPA